MDKRSILVIKLSTLLGFSSIRSFCQPLSSNLTDSLDSLLVMRKSECFSVIHVKLIGVTIQCKRLLLRSSRCEPSKAFHFNYRFGCNSGINHSKESKGEMTVVWKQKKYVWNRYLCTTSISVGPNSLALNYTVLNFSEFENQDKIVH